MAQEKRTREEVLAKLRQEFAERRAAGEDLSLDSDAIREAQVAKTEERIEVVRNLRLDSLARSTQGRIGGGELSAPGQASG